MEGLFKQFYERDAFDILFMASLVQVEFWRSKDGGPERLSLIKLVDDEIASRTAVVDRMKEDVPVAMNPIGKFKPTQLSYNVELNAKWGNKSKQERYTIYTRLTDAFEFAASTPNVDTEDILRLKLVPRVSLAISLQRALEGRLFCTLPLAITTALSGHLNSFFGIAPDRRSLLSGDDLRGSPGSNGFILAAWNQHLFSRVIPPLFARFLEDAARDTAIPDHQYYMYWPQDDSSGQYWGDLLSDIWKLCLDADVLRCVGESKLKDVTSPNKCFLLPDGLSGDSCIVKYLNLCGQTVVAPPPFLRSRLSLRVVTPIKFLELTNGRVFDSIDLVPIWKFLGRTPLDVLKKKGVLSNQWLLCAEDGTKHRLVSINSKEEGYMCSASNEVRRLFPEDKGIFLKTELQGVLPANILKNDGTWKIFEVASHFKSFLQRSSSPHIRNAPEHAVDIQFHIDLCQYICKYVLESKADILKEFKLVPSKTGRLFSVPDIMLYRRNGVTTRYGGLKDLCVGISFIHTSLVDSNIATHDLGLAGLISHVANFGRPLRKNTRDALLDAIIREFPCSNRISRNTWGDIGKIALFENVHGQSVKVGKDGAFFFDSVPSLPKLPTRFTSDLLVRVRQSTMVMCCDLFPIRCESFGATFNRFVKSNWSKLTTKEAQDVAIYLLGMLKRNVVSQLDMFEGLPLVVTDHGRYRVNQMYDHGNELLDAILLPEWRVPESYKSFTPELRRLGLQTVLSEDDLCRLLSDLSETAQFPVLSTWIVALKLGSCSWRFIPTNGSPSMGQVIRPANVPQFLPGISSAQECLLLIMSQKPKDSPMLLDGMIRFLRISFCSI